MKYVCLIYVSVSEREYKHLNDKQNQVVHKETNIRRKPFNKMGDTVRMNTFDCRAKSW